LINREKVLLVNVHNPIPHFEKKPLPTLGFSIWWYTDDFRNLRVEQLLDDLAQHPDETIIFAGDFNMNSYTVDYNKFSAYQDAFKAGGNGMGFTWPNARVAYLRIPLDIPLFRLDYIFTTTDVAILSAEKLSSTGSDHIPLFAILSLPAD
jgi:endonuclease/exonuclease/phosphatase (EEP) superfamily protein YafD